MAMQYIKKGDHFGKVKADDINALYRVFDTVKGDGSVSIIKGGQDGSGWLIHGGGASFPEIQAVGDADANENDENYDEDCSLDAECFSVERRVRMRDTGNGHNKQNEFRLYGFKSPTQTGNYIDDADDLPEADDFQILLRVTPDGGVPTLTYAKASLLSGTVDSEADSQITKSLEHADESGHEGELRIFGFKSPSSANVDIADADDLPTSYRILIRDGDGNVPVLKYVDPSLITPQVDTGASPNLTSSIEVATESEHKGELRIKGMNSTSATAYPTTTSAASGYAIMARKDKDVKYLELPVIGDGKMKIEFNGTVLSQYYTANQTSDKTISFSQSQSNWDETDTSAVGYIKNKPRGVDKVFEYVHSIDYNLSDHRLTFRTKKLTFSKGLLTNAGDTIWGYEIDRAVEETV